MMVYQTKTMYVWVVYCVVMHRMLIQLQL